LPACSFGLFEELRFYSGINLVPLGIVVNCMGGLLKSMRLSRNASSLMGCFGGIIGISLGRKDDRLGIWRSWKWIFCAGRLWVSGSGVYLTVPCLRFTWSFISVAVRNFRPHPTSHSKME